ncbi:MAG: DUF4058 family protein [Planctomycetaceae bacterium]
MPSPFPGMDPWLEASDEWPGFHDTLVIKTVEALQPQLRDRGYYAKPGERVWVGRVRGVIPDVALISRKPTSAAAPGTLALAEPTEPVYITRSEIDVHEGFVDILRSDSHELVTSLEYLSPTNKSNRKGRRLYRLKQRDLRRGQVHLVEMDLIRRGPHVLDVPEELVRQLKPWTYLINVVRRASDSYEVYPVPLRAPLPRIRLPLSIGDEDGRLDLQDVFNRSYDIGPYPERLDYAAPPPPPELNLDDAAWAAEILRSKGLRQ